jgi:hypothetical protein
LPFALPAGCFGSSFGLRPCEAASDIQPKLSIALARLSVPKDWDSEYLSNTGCVIQLLFSVSSQGIKMKTAFVFAVMTVFALVSSGCGGHGIFWK